MSAPMTAEQMTQLDDAATQEAIHRVAGWAAAHYQELPDIADIQFAVRGAIAWRIELIALRARVGELSEDKARLNWCENYLWTARAEIRNDFAGLRYRKVTICCPNNPKGWEDVTAETLRDAIDYASERATPATTEETK